MAAVELQEKDMEAVGGDYVVVTNQKGAPKYGIVFVEARVKDDLEDEIDMAEV